MTTNAKRMPHINVCICSFKRPVLLKHLLSALQDQECCGLFTYSVIVADNDVYQSAKQVVAEFSAQPLLHVTYCLEPVQNIALARNRALMHVTGDWVAFIDDDEIPRKEWLRDLYLACCEHQADGALGPVEPRFEHKPPDWILSGNLLSRPRYHTGYKLKWSEARTGNVLFKRDILIGFEAPFDARFGAGGEDVDFFRRIMAAGRLFVWCNTAVVDELVPPSRSNRRYLLKLALLRGNNAAKQPVKIKQGFLKSCMAIPVYLVILPFLLVMSHSLFMKFMIKLCDHAGRLLGLMHLNPMRTKVIT